MRDIPAGTINFLSSPYSANDVVKQLKQPKYRTAKESVPITTEPDLPPEGGVRGWICVVGALFAYSALLDFSTRKHFQSHNQNHDSQI
jgi:hypothetical protein